MKAFSNPLDNIRVASPCSADWDKMYGNDRKRFCAECNLNVYNLSDMTRQEAENFLIMSEGSICVRFFRRADGTVLTRNCPVGWRATVRRTSKAITAIFSLVAGVFCGVSGIKAVDSFVSILPIDDVPPIETSAVDRNIPIFDERIPTAGEVDITDFRPAGSRSTTLGRVVNVEKLEDQKVVAWVK